MKFVVAGAGIGGLFTALRLHRAGMDVEIYEQRDRIRALGVGINLLPQAVTELADVGPRDKLDEVAVQTAELTHAHRLGQPILRQASGLVRWVPHSTSAVLGRSNGNREAVSR